MELGQTIALIKALGSGGGGGDSGVVVVHDVDGTLDKTWQEIFDAAAAGKAVIAVEASTEEEGNRIVFSAFLSVVSDADDYYAQFICSVALEVKVNTYVATTANDYPVFED